MSAPLAAGAVLLVFAAIWELAGDAGHLVGRLANRLGRGRTGGLVDAAARMRLPELLVRAGLAERVEPAAVIAAKWALLAAGAVIGLVAAPAVAPRLGAVVVGVSTVAGFLAPDAALHRLAARRRERLVAALPDALDMLAVGAASGRDPAAAFGEIAAGTTGPLAAELAATTAEVECVTPARTAIARLRDRVPGAELGALATALERSRRFGSPLADQLHEQASSLRRDSRRRIEDRAAKAAPKIQLVVALVLVPSVLLLIAAAVLAHSDQLLGQL